MLTTTPASNLLHPPVLFITGKSETVPAVTLNNSFPCPLHMVQHMELEKIPFFVHAIEFSSPSSAPFYVQINHTQYVPERSSATPHGIPEAIQDLLMKCHANPQVQIELHVHHFGHASLPAPRSTLGLFCAAVRDPRNRDLQRARRGRDLDRWGLTGAADTPPLNR